MTIQDKCIKLNNDIHKRMFQKNHFESSFGHYEKCFTSLDLIEDCQDAIDEFINLPESILQNRSVLNIYGVLQAMFCQQDGLFGLFQNISKNQDIKLDDFFTKFQFNKEIRKVRNDIVGHPTSRNNNSEFYFIDKGPNSKFRFSYAGYNPEYRVVKVDLRKFIDDQMIFTEKILESVENIIQTAMEQHKKEYKNRSLHSIISDLNYSILSIKRGIWDSQRSFQAEPGLKIVRASLTEFIDELKLRYKGFIPESVEHTTKTIEYILNKIEIWLNNGELFGNEDARIFMIAFDKEFNDLIQMSKELDKEYTSDHTS